MSVYKLCQPGEELWVGKLCNMCPCNSWAPWVATVVPGSEAAHLPLPQPLASSALDQWGPLSVFTVPKGRRGGVSLILESLSVMVCLRDTSPPPSWSSQYGQKAEHQCPCHCGAPENVLLLRSRLVAERLLDCHYEVYFQCSSQIMCYVQGQCSVY